jgi:uncharacterized protein (TIGR02588 family)
VSEEPKPLSDHGHPRRGPRRLAEWLTFGISAALLLVLGGHLTWRMREPVDDVAFAQVVLRPAAVREHDGRFALPIDIENPSRRAMRDVLIRVRRPGPDNTRESVDVLVDYLGQRSSQTIYVYSRVDPRAGGIDAEALSYRVD